MPTYRVTMPDGKEFEVTSPDDREMSEDEILSALGQGQPKKPKITAQEYDNAWLANVAGLGTSLGDEFLAGVGSVFRPDMGDYSKQLGTIRDSQRKLSEYDPAGSIVSNVVGGIPTAFLGGPATSAVSKLLPSVGKVGNAAVTGAGFGAVSGFGSGEGGLRNRVGSAGVGAVLGAGAGATLEGVVAPLAGKLLYSKSAPAMFNQNTGNLTPQGMKFVAEYAKQNKLDIDELTTELQREIAAQASTAGKTRALNPQQAIALAEAQSLPVKAPMTQGQLTQDPMQYLFESEAAKGRFGEMARNPIQKVYDAQQEVLQANAAAIRNQVAGLKPGVDAVSEPGMRGQAIQSALASLRDNENEAVRALYQAARRGGDAAIDGTAYRQGVQNVLLDVAEDFSPDSVPKVTSILRQLSANADNQGSADTLVSSVFRARRNLTSLQGEFGTVEGAAAGRAKQALDKYLIDTMDEAAISGDAGAIDRWREAIKAFRAYATKFEGDDLIQTLTERGNTGSSLKVDPVDAVNVIFGRDAVGFVGKGGLTRDLKKMRDVLGDDSAAWKALKEEAFLRFLRKSDGAMRPTEQAFSGANFSKAWNDAQKNSPHILRVLFTKDEQNLISQFARYAQRVTVAPTGGVNTSNTTGAAMMFLQKLLGSKFAGPKLEQFLQTTPVLKGLVQIPDAYRAGAAAQPVVQSTVIPSTARIRPELTALAGQNAGNRQ